MSNRKFNTLLKRVTSVSLSATLLLTGVMGYDLFFDRSEHEAKAAYAFTTSSGFQTDFATITGLQNMESMDNTGNTTYWFGGNAFYGLKRSTPEPGENYNSNDWLLVDTDAMWEGDYLFTTWGAPYISAATLNAAGTTADLYGVSEDASSILTNQDVSDSKGLGTNKIYYQKILSYGELLWNAKSTSWMSTDEINALNTATISCIGSNYTTFEHAIAGELGDATAQNNHWIGAGTSQDLDNGLYKNTYVKKIQPDSSSDQYMKLSSGLTAKTVKCSAGNIMVSKTAPAVGEYYGIGETNLGLKASNSYAVINAHMYAPSAEESRINPTAMKKIAENITNDYTATVCNKNVSLIEKLSALKSSNKSSVVDLNYTKGLQDGTRNDLWTRTFGGLKNSNRFGAWLINNSGNLVSNQDLCTAQAFTPALNLDTSKVVMMKTTDGLLANASVSSNLNTLDFGDSKDRRFAITSSSIGTNGTGFTVDAINGKYLTNIVPGQTYQFTYKNATTSLLDVKTRGNTSVRRKLVISGAIYDENNKMLYYGNLATINDNGTIKGSTSGNVQITIPEDLKVGQSYKLAFFEEQINSACDEYTSPGGNKIKEYNCDYVSAKSSISQFTVQGISVENTGTNYIESTTPPVYYCIKVKNAEGTSISSDKYYVVNRSDAKKITDANVQSYKLTNFNFDSNENNATKKYEYTVFYFGEDGTQPPQTAEFEITVNANVAQKNQDIDNLKQELLNTQAELDVKKKELEQKEAELAQKEADLQKTQEDLAKAKDEIAQLQADITSLENSIKQIIEKINELGEIIGSTFNPDATDLIKEFENAVSSLKEKLEEIKSALDAANTELGETKASYIASANTLITAVNGLCGTSISTLNGNASNSEISLAIDNAVQAISNDYTEKTNRVSELEAQYLEIAALLSDYIIVDNNFDTGTISKIKSGITQILADLETANNTITEKENEIKRVKEELKNVTTERDSLQTAFENKQKELDNANKKIGELEITIEEQQGTIEEQLSQIENLNGQITNLNTDISAMEGSMKEIIGNINTALGLSGDKAFNPEADDLTSEYERAVAALQNKLSQVKTDDIASVNAMIDAVNLTYGSNISKLAEDATSDQINAAIANALEVINNDYNAKTKKVSELKEQYIAISKLLTGYMDETDNFEDCEDGTVDQIKSAIAVAMKDLNGAKKELSDIDNALMSLYDALNESMSNMQNPGIMTLEAVEEDDTKESAADKINSISGMVAMLTSSYEENNRFLRENICQINQAFKYGDYVRYNDKPVYYIFQNDIYYITESGNRTYLSSPDGVEFNVCDDQDAKRVAYDSVTGSKYLHLTDEEHGWYPWLPNPLDEYKKAVKALLNGFNVANDNIKILIDTINNVCGFQEGDENYIEIPENATADQINNAMKKALETINAQLIELDKQNRTYASQYAEAAKALSEFLDTDYGEAVKAENAAEITVAVKACTAALAKIRGEMNDVNRALANLYGALSEAMKNINGTSPVTLEEIGEDEGNNEESDDESAADKIESISQMITMITDSYNQLKAQYDALNKNYQNVIDSVYGEGEKTTDEVSPEEIKEQIDKNTQKEVDKAVEEALRDAVDLDDYAEIIQKNIAGTIDDILDGKEYATDKMPQELVESLANVKALKEKVDAIEDGAVGITSVLETISDALGLENTATQADILAAIQGLRKQVEDLTKQVSDLTTENASLKEQLKNSQNGDYTTGYADGFKAGVASVGKDSGTDSYQNGFNTGYSTGYSAGFAAGKNQESSANNDSSADNNNSSNDVDIKVLQSEVKTLKTTVNSQNKTIQSQSNTIANLKGQVTSLKKDSGNSNAPVYNAPTYTAPTYTAPSYTSPSTPTQSYTVPSSSYVTPVQKVSATPIASTNTSTTTKEENKTEKITGTPLSTSNNKEDEDSESFDSKKLNTLGVTVLGSLPTFDDTIEISLYELSTTNSYSKTVETNLNLLDESTSNDKANANQIFAYYAANPETLAELTGDSQIVAATQDSTMTVTVKGITSFEASPTKKQQESIESGKGVNVKVASPNFQNGSIYLIVHDSIKRGEFDVLAVRAEDATLHFHLDDLSPISIAEVGVVPKVTQMEDTISIPYEESDIPSTEITDEDKSENGIGVFSIIAIILIIICIGIIAYFVAFRKKSEDSYDDNTFDEDDDII